MKEKIVGIANNMFLKLGFKNVSMDDIAGEMCISKKTIYKYFCNKEQLVEDSVESIRNIIFEKFKVIAKHNFNAVEENFQTRQIFQEMVHNEGSSPLFQLKKYYPEVYEKTTSGKLELFDEFHIQNISKGIKEGLFRANIDIKAAVQLYRILTFGINERTESEKEAQKLELQALENHIRAIATPKGLEELEKQLEKTSNLNI